MRCISKSGCAAAILSTACFLSCGGDKSDADSSEKSKPKTGSLAKSQDAKSLDTLPPKTPDLREGYHLARSLLAEQSRAELRFGGPFIDFGTPDQNKYLRGGWGTGWSFDSTASDTSASTLIEKSAKINTFLTSPPKELVLRARSLASTQTLSFSVGRQSIGQVTLSQAWQILRLPMPKTGIGRKKFKITRSENTNVEIDWLWLSGALAQPAPSELSHSGAATIGKHLRRSLLAATAQSYSFYLQVPKAATLIFDYASKSGQKFVVRVQRQGKPILELFRSRSSEAWKSAKVDLTKLSGQLVRLELATEGSGTGGAWGEPGIFVPAAKQGEEKTITKVAKAKNLILIIMDTTRADQFEAFSPQNGIYTPKLDAFAKKSTTFTRAYNAANWTKPSVLSIFSGLYPATHTATKPESMVPSGVKLISEHLQTLGLRTQGFSSNPVVSAKFGFERGWDNFGVFYENEARGEAMYKRAGNWVEDNGDSPFFLFIQTIDPHTTYAVSRKYWGRYYKKNYQGPIGATFTREDQKKINDKELTPSADDVAWIRALYHGEISYQDEHVGGFLDKLEALGRLEDTLVVVTNDHGEEIYDHGSFGHGWTLFEEMTRAPLMIHYPPQFPEGEEVSTITEQVDLAPTVLEAMGLPPMRATEGTSFLSSLHGLPYQEPHYALSHSDNNKRAIHVGDWKLEVSKSKGWKYLFNMTTKNPEKIDRRSDSELAGRYCEVYMGEALANPAKLSRLGGIGQTKRFQAQDANMDAATRKQMEALGYL